MLRIKTTLGLSRLHGIGLFADQFIPRGTVTWRYDPDLDPSFPMEKIEGLIEIHRLPLERYGYYDYGIKKFVVCLDDQRFINHSSKNYNIISLPECDTADRDIEVGEELLCNYNHYEPGWFEKRKMQEMEFVELDFISE